MEATSARLKTPRNMPMVTMMLIQIVPAVPPFARPKVLVTTENSQVFPSTTT
jgi:hypothetical protein